MKSQRMILLALLAAVLAACSPKGAQDSTTSTSPAVATVDGQKIDRDLYEFYAKGVANKPSSDLTPEQRDQVLENLIRAKVIAEQAEKDGTAKEPNTAALLELSRLNVLQQAVSEKYLKDRKATDQELRAEYETQVGQLPKLEYHARHILVATEAFAGKVVAELEKGAKFEDVAKRESMDSKENGGDLGWFTPDRMVKPFADAVVALKPGEYTHAPVQTQFGWHVIKLEETRNVAPPAYDQVKARVEQMVQGKKFKTYVDDLMKTAKVEKKLDATAAAAPGAPAAPATEKKP
ncbi:MAG: peptidylprolyl isomerase [Gammaproteobacteria bacterium]